jgi:hypothetical protein
LQFIKPQPLAKLIIEELQDITIQDDSPNLLTRIQHVEITLKSGGEAFIEEFIA